MKQPRKLLTEATNVDELEAIINDVCEMEQVQRRLARLLHQCSDYQREFQARMNPNSRRDCEDRERLVQHVLNLRKSLRLVGEARETSRAAIYDLGNQFNDEVLADSPDLQPA